MKADLLHREFAPDALPADGGRMLLPADRTLALIARATEEGVPIVAVRGVADPRKGGARGDAADYTASVAEGHGCWADADAFVRAHDARGLLFDVTLGDDPIEAV